MQCYESATSLYIVEGSQVRLVFGKLRHGFLRHCIMVSHVFQMSLQNGEDYSQEKRWSGMCGVALYKGVVVSIDEIIYPRKTKELTRTAKLEMRIMRQLHHDNINSFMGQFSEAFCRIFFASSLQWFCK